MIEGHLKMNRIDSRVTVHPVAVGTSAGAAWLTDEQGSSRSSMKIAYSAPSISIFSRSTTILAKMLTPFEPGFVDLRSPAGIGIAAIVYNYDGDADV
jgi:hypothetical protein